MKIAKLFSLTSLTALLASPASAAVVLTSNFSAGPTTHGDNIGTVVSDSGGTPIIDFKLDVRNPVNANLIWLGANQHLHPTSFNIFNPTLATPLAGGLEFATSTGLANGAVWGMNFVTFADTSFNGGAPAVLGFELTDVDMDGLWSSGDLVDLVGLAYDPDFPTDGTSMVLDETMVRAAFAPVPEPSRALLLGLAGLTILARRRRA